MKDIKSYIHLYIGCRAKTTGGKYGKIVSASVDGTAIIVYDNEDPRGFVISIAALKLILRPLSEMSDAEAVDLCEIVTDQSRHGDIELMGAITDRHIWYIDGSRDQGDGFDEVRDLYVYFDEMKPEQIRYCLSKGFDLFGLKEAGLAVYETEIKK